MKRFILFLLIATGIAAFSAAQTTGIEPFRQEGIASWYGREFDGKPTASGEIYNSGLFTAAHPTLEFDTYLTVTNRQNGRRVTVRVNDRGPFVAARIIDLSRAAAEALDMITTGTAPVIVEKAVNTVLGPVTVSPAAAAQAVPPPAPSAQETLQTSPAPVVRGLVEIRPETSAAASPVPPPPAPPAQTLPPAASAPASSALSTVSTLPPAPPAQTLPPAVNAPAPSALSTVSTLPPAPPVVFAPAPPAEIKGGVPAAGSAKMYRLQVGAYTIPRNAVDAFDKLKNAGLNPAYEKYGSLYRVVLAGLKAADISAIAQTLGNAGFREALIREETGF